MFSDELLGKIFVDERLRNVPLEYQTTTLNVVQDVIEKRFCTENPYMSREEILNDICNRD